MRKLQLRKRIENRLPIIEKITNISFVGMAACIPILALATIMPWVSLKGLGSFSGWETNYLTPDWTHWGEGLFVGHGLFSILSITTVGVLIILALAYGIRYRTPSLLLLFLWALLVGMVFKNFFYYSSCFHSHKYYGSVGWGQYLFLCISILGFFLIVVNIGALSLEDIASVRELESVHKAI